MVGMKSKTKQEEQESWIRRYLKPYSWRATAVYFWLTAIAAIFGVYGTFLQVEQLFFDSVLNLLASVGFEPVRPTNVGAIFKVMWVLVITGLRPLELAGLAIYVLASPVWVPGRYLLNRYLTNYGTDPLKRTRPPIAPDQSFRPLAFCTLGFGAWFVLYGGASEPRMVLPGILLSGGILFLLAYRLFSRVRPTVVSSVGRFDWFVSITEYGLSQYPDIPTKEYGNRGELMGEVAILRLHLRLARRIALLLRGRRTQERLAMLVFGEYLISLVTVAAAAILFWALVISIAGTEPIPLTESLRHSTAYFLPAVEPPDSNAALPYWARIGPSATSWVLFVLYIGPAGSVLPERQRAAATELAVTYRTFRRYVVGFRRGIRARERLMAQFPQ